MILDKVNSTKDLKQLSISELPELGREIRSVLLKKLSNTGGHIGPNLCMVEATVAIHYVFDSPYDKVIFDVSHQSGTHKILTGRKSFFTDSEKFGLVSLYTNPNESEHDFFVIGHTSTSISLGCGVVKARDQKGNKENVIVVIGDGSLSGGEAYEGLNNISEMGTNMIILVNDNEMSVAENHGGLYRNLENLRNTKGAAENNFFKAIGLDYIYIEDGHDIKKLIHVFKTVKDINHPVVVHIHTTKGKGYEFAEKNKELWHARYPFELETGKLKEKNEFEEDYSSITAEFLLEKMKKDRAIVAITSGTPDVFGFNPIRRKQAGEQFVDVGIAEEHAVAMASGIAAYGAKPVYGVFSSFIQRAYDQLSQDLCINNNPALILVFGGGVNGFLDTTHLGFFDIPVISNIPNMVYLAPTCKEEYLSMLEWGIWQQEYPVAIRIPGIYKSRPDFEESFWSTELNKYKVEEEGNEIAILALGGFYDRGKAVKDMLESAVGIKSTLINPRYITGVDEKLLEQLKDRHRLIVTLEDGVLDGGFGDKISRYYGKSSIKVINYGLKKEFIDKIPISQIISKNHLEVDIIVSEIMTCFNSIL